MADSLYAFSKKCLDTSFVHISPSPSEYPMSLVKMNSISFQKQFLICFNLCLVLEWRLVHAMISGPDIEVWFWTHLHLWMSFWITWAIPSCAWICTIGLELAILPDSELMIHCSHEYEPLYNCMPRYLNPWTIPSDSELQCAPNIFRSIPLDTHHCSLWKKIVYDSSFSKTVSLY